MQYVHMYLTSYVDLSESKEMFLRVEIAEILLLLKISKEVYFTLFKESRNKNICQRGVNRDWN